MEYQRLCSLYHKKPDETMLGSLDPDGGVDVTSYGRPFFKACGVGKEKAIAKKVKVPVLMIFSRDDAFFDVRGAYDVLTEIGSDKKEIILVDKAGHYSVIEKSHDILYRWLDPMLPKP
jgi:pimeloyl-ACP methyl ester carboxylesterase